MYSTTEKMTIATGLWHLRTTGGEQYVMTSYEP